MARSMMSSMTVHPVHDHVYIDHNDAWDQDLLCCQGGLQRSNDHIKTLRLACI